MAHERSEVYSGKIAPTPSLINPRFRHFLAGMIVVVTMIGVDVLAIVVATTAAVFLADTQPLSGLFAPLQFAGASGKFAIDLEITTTQSCIMLYFFARGHYKRRLPFWSEAQDILLVSLFAIMSCSFSQYMSEKQISLGVWISIWSLFPVSAVVMRRLAKHALYWAGLWQINVLLIGNDKAAAEAEVALARESLLGYRVVATLSLETLVFHAALGPSHLRNLLDQHAARRIVLAHDGSTEKGREIVQSLVKARIDFSLIPQTGGMPVTTYEPVEFFSRDIVLLSYQNNLSEPGARGLKALFDTVVATLLLAFLAGPMLLVAVLVSLDGGPVLFSHRRIGAGGREFGCLKFRTMVVDAEQVLAELLERDPSARAEWAETQKLRNDPRITPIGRFLRATSIDELPQLINVIRQQMSLVGPRPIVRKEVLKYADDIDYYYGVKPGLTGLWQVSGRSNTNYDRRVELDRWYVRNWTIWYDIAILIKTVPALLNRNGAR